MDSRGLLILSNDGVLAKAVIGPQSGLEKEYQVRVTGAVTGATGCGTARVVKPRRDGSYTRTPAGPDALTVSCPAASHC